MYKTRDCFPVLKTWLILGRESDDRSAPVSNVCVGVMPLFGCYSMAVSSISKITEHFIHKSSLCIQSEDKRGQCRNIRTKVSFT